MLDERTRTKKPPMYKVLLHNDDYTTREFVVWVLQTVFHKNEGDAIAIMSHVHNNGVGVAGVYTFEVAETKVTKTIAARKGAAVPAAAVDRADRRIRLIGSTRASRGLCLWKAMLSPELQATLQRAVDDVRGRRHEYLTLEHLLLSILDDPSGADIVTQVRRRHREAARRARAVPRRAGRGAARGRGVRPRPDAGVPARAAARRDARPGGRPRSR